MKLSIVFCVCVFFIGAISHMPTVYEFCSHVVATGTFPNGPPTCDASQCQGRPGKIGPVGPVGPKGISGERGQKGEKGTNEDLKEKIQVLEDKQKKFTEALIRAGGDVTEAICYMGIKSKRIPNSAMTASSQWDGSYAAYLGRLDNLPSSGSGGVWHPARGRNVVGEWIQVDFGSPSDVAGVITQGRQQYHEWVTSYKISCGNTVDTMTVVTENGSEKVFSGNRDKDSKVYNSFPQPLTCRYIRIYPQTWQESLTMRIEFVKESCYDYFTL